MTAADTKPTRPEPSREDKIDRQMKDSFPASDPPSFSGGNHTIGAPRGRESEPPGADDPDVQAARKKAHKQEKKA